MPVYAYTVLSGVDLNSSGTNMRWMRNQEETLRTCAALTGRGLGIRDCRTLLGHILTGHANRSMSRRPVAPTAKERIARSTPNTRLRSTKPARSVIRLDSPTVRTLLNCFACVRPHSSHKANADMTANNRVTVVRRSRFSTKRPRPPKKSC